jgi:hypothetical protein
MKTGHPQKTAGAMLTAWAALLGTHVFLTYALWGQGGELPDESAYSGLAHNLLRSGAFHLDFAEALHAAGAPNTHYAPGWPAWMAAMTWLFGSQGYPLAVAFAWGLAMIGAWLLAEKMRLAERWRWVVVIGLTVNPLLIFYHGHVMGESLTIALSFFLLGAAIDWLRTLAGGFTLRWATLRFAILTALAHLTRTQLLIIPLGAFGLAGQRYARKSKAIQRQWLLWGAALLTFHFALISPWLWRMAQVGAPGIFTEVNLGYSLYLFNHPEVKNPYSPDSGATGDFPSQVLSLSASERDQLLLGLALQEIAHRPGRYLQNCLRRLGYLLSPVAHFYGISLERQFIILLSTIFFVYLPLVAVAWGAWRERLNRIESRLLAGTLIAWFLFHGLVNASLINRLPSDCWLWVLGTALIAQSGKRRRSGHADDPSLVRAA